MPEIKPTCPYCGAAMGIAGCDDYYWFVCHKCDAASPPAYDRADALAKALHRASVWYSVRDGMPDKDKDVLVACRSKNGVYNIDKGYYNGERMVHRGSAEVTHWMPLPKAPKEE